MLNPLDRSLFGHWLAGSTLTVHLLASPTQDALPLECGRSRLHRAAASSGGEPAYQRQRPPAVHRLAAVVHPSRSLP